MSDRNHLREILRGRVAALEERIQDACRRGGRRRHDVTLVAVTKTVAPEVAALLPEFGIGDLGESRPQELARKRAKLTDIIRWHQIGHLQRNKVAMVLPTRLIHSVDSWRLLEALEREAATRQISQEVLLEVNAANDPSKQGFVPEEVTGLVPQLATFRNIRVTGLMTMAALEPAGEKSRATFVRLRQCRDRLNQSLPETRSLTHLSMGMTNDFPVAIEEGATIIRVGTFLFDGMEEN